jgi:DNA modification methylase
MNKFIRDLKFDMLPISSLVMDERNPRTHTPKQIRQIADSIRTLGFNNPVLVDDHGNVVAGHGRIKAAELLGIVQVPTIRLSQMTDDERCAYAIADNKLAVNAGWDRELLSKELRYISELEIDLDPTITGFEAAEIDILCEVTDQGAADDEAEQIPDVDSHPRVSRSGDLWLLGRRHRLLCANATDPRAFDLLLAGKQAGLVFIDPPYNVKIGNNVSGLGQIKHREFAMGSGEMSSVEFTAFLTMVFQHLVAHSVDGSIHFVCMDWRHLDELLAAGKKTYSELKNLCVWAKDNAGMGSLYRSQHELVFVFKSGSAPHLNNVRLGTYGRNRSNLWNYPGANSIRAGRLEELAMHPTVKPIALVADAILDCSKRGAIVLDCFGGSGTMLIAAETTSRRGYVMEIDPAFIDVAIRRFEKVTGITARHAETQQTFQEVEQERNAIETHTVSSGGETNNG